MARLICFFLALCTACSPDFGVTVGESGIDTVSPTDNDDASGTEEDEQEDVEDVEQDEEEVEEDWSMYDGAMIEIVTPASGDFLEWGAVQVYEAQVVNPEGVILESDAIMWSSDSDEIWIPEGPVIEDDTLDVGTHTLTAMVELPNGDRLAHSIGGVLVQHEAAGTYVGDMMVSIDMEYGGTPLGASCIGGAIVVIDAYGETALGDSSCTLDLLGYISFDVHHVFEYEVMESDIEGAAYIALDIVGIELPFESEGSLADGDLDAAWGGSFAAFADIEGTLDVSRITREITEIE